MLALKKAGFSVAAAGDSYNDLTMIQTAERGLLFHPPASILKSHKTIPAVYSYEGLLKGLTRNLEN